MMNKKIVGLLGSVVMVGGLLAGCSNGGNDQGQKSASQDQGQDQSQVQKQEKKKTVKTLDVTFKDFKSNWMKFINKAKGHENDDMPKGVLKALDISDLSVKKHKFSESLPNGFILKGKVADNNKLISVTLTGQDDDQSNDDSWNDLKKDLASGFMAMGLFMRATNPKMTDDDKPFQALGIVDKNGQIIMDKEKQDKTHTAVIHGVKYTMNDQGLKAVPA